MLANLYLHSFDYWIINDLSRIFDLRYVRYADDFVILLKKQSDISHVHSLVLKQLELLKLELHNLDSSKTRYVDIDNEGMKFLGFFLNGDDIRIHEDNVSKFKKRIEAKLRICEGSREKIEQDYKFGAKPKNRLKLFVSRVINRKIIGSGEGICEDCGGLTGEKIKSWIGFFSAVTDVNQLHEIDKWIRKTLGKYFWERYGICLNRSDFREAGLASLEQEYYKICRRKSCKCTRNETCTLTKTN